MMAIVMTILAGLVTLIWVSRHIQLELERRNGFELTEDYPCPAGEIGKISVLIAAKDEQANIAPCIESLLMQDYPNLEIIVCNDRSDDATGEIIHKFAAEDSRIRAIDVAELPPGWKGKNHAMHLASQLATGEYLLCIDADCKQLSPRSLSVAMQLMADRQAGLLCLLPNLEMKGFWENVVQPVGSGILMYDAIGGHEALRDVMQEDMAIAGLVKQRQLGLSVARSNGLYSVRMYTTFAQTIQGWTRIFFGSFPSLTRLTISLTLILMVGLFPYLAAAMGLSLGEGDNLWRVCGYLGVATVVLQLTLMAGFYRLIRVRWELFWTYPLGVLLTAWTIFQAMLKHIPGAKITWKGTAYSQR